MPHQRNAPEIAPVSDEIVASTPPAPATPETESNENKEAKPTRFKVSPFISSLDYHNRETFLGG